MKRWDTRKTPWLTMAEGEYEKRLRLHFRPRMADWLYVIVLGILPLFTLILMVALGIPIANARPGPQPVLLIAILGVTIVFVGAHTVINLLKHWCLLDFQKGGPVKKRDALGTEHILMTNGLEELQVRYFVTRGRHSQHVCALEAVAGETTTEVHRCYGRQAKALAEKLETIAKEAGFQRESITA